jgi:hypothetical protein
LTMIKSETRGACRHGGRGEPDHIITVAAPPSAVSLNRGRNQGT